MTKIRLRQKPEALVFMLVGLKGHWKYPAEYVLYDKINSENLKCLISIILTEARKRDINIHSVTMGGTTANMVFANKQISWFYSKDCHHGLLSYFLHCLVDTCCIVDGSVSNNFLQKTAIFIATHLKKSLLLHINFFIHVKFLYLLPAMSSFLLASINPMRMTRVMHLVLILRHWSILTLKPMNR